MNSNSFDEIKVWRESILPPNKYGKTAIFDGGFMALTIDSRSSDSVQLGSFQQDSHPVQRNAVPNRSDSIRSGADEETFFSSFTTKIQTFLSWIYLHVRNFFTKIFFCNSSEEPTIGKYQKAIAELDSLRRLFVQKSQGDRASLQSWWKKSFNSLDLDVRKMLFFEDVITYAPADVNDKEAWATAHYSEKLDLAILLVKELGEITIEEETYDSIDAVPEYIDRVKAKLEKKSKEKNL